MTKHKRKLIPEGGNFRYCTFVGYKGCEVDFTTKLQKCVMEMLEKKTKQRLSIFLFWKTF